MVLVCQIDSQSCLALEPVPSGVQGPACDSCVVHVQPLISCCYKWVRGQTFPYNLKLGSKHRWLTSVSLVRNQHAAWKLWQLPSGGSELPFTVSCVNARGLLRLGDRMSESRACGQTVAVAPAGQSTQDKRGRL